MRMHALSDAGLLARLATDQANRGQIERMGGTHSRWEEPVLRPTPMPVCSQDLPQLRGEHDVALTAAFAMADEDQHSFPVEVADLQLPYFGSAHTGGIQSRQQCAMLQVVRCVH